MSNVYLRDKTKTNKDFVDMNDNPCGRVIVAESPPPIVSGVSSCGEINTSSSSLSTTTLNFPSGLKSISVEFINNSTSKYNSIANGTTTSHLIDSNTDFVAIGVTTASTVYNKTDSTFANVTAVADGDLTLDADIFVSGEAYAVTTLTDVGSVKAYVAFNNSIFNDVAVAGLRKVVPIGASKTYIFSDNNPPTSVDLVADSVETEAGDTIIIWEASAYE